MLLDSAVRESARGAEVADDVLLPFERLGFLRFSSLSCVSVLEKHARVATARLKVVVMCGGDESEKDVPSRECCRYCTRTTCMILVHECTRLHPIGSQSTK